MVRTAAVVVVVVVVVVVAVVVVAVGNSSVLITLQIDSFTEHTKHSDTLR